MPEVIVNGMSIHYVSDDLTDPWCKRDAVWIQHGFGRNSMFWNRWVASIGGRYRVVRRDMPGHGRSSDPGPDYRWTLEGAVDDMVGFLDALGLDSVHYVGESAGGFFGMAFAASHADRLKSLTLCSSPTGVPKAAVNAIASPPGYAGAEGAASNLSMADYVRKAVAGRMLTSLGPDHLEWVIEEWSKNRPHVLNGLSQLLDSVDLTGLLGKIAVPTLVLAPTQSPIASLVDQRRMASSISDAELVEIAGVGHEIYVDQAESCVSALLAFLDRQSTTPAD